jgi:hypothetical protein
MSSDKDKDAAARELLEIFADCLEMSHGPCLAGRAALMDWLDDQFLRMAQLDVPDQLASSMIDTEYMLWQAKGLDLGDDQE